MESWNRDKVFQLTAIKLFNRKTPLPDKKFADQNQYFMERV